MPQFVPTLGQRHGINGLFSILRSCPTTPLEGCMLLLVAMWCWPLLATSLLLQMELQIMEEMGLFRSLEYTSHYCILYTATRCCNSLYVLQVSSIYLLMINCDNFSTGHTEASYSLVLPWSLSGSASCTPRWIYKSSC
jgi:hypothetical protein